MNRTSRISMIRLAVSCALLASLALPATAFAAKQPAKTPSGVAQAAAKDSAKTAALKAKIERILAARRVRFDAAVTDLSARIGRVDQLAGEVAAAGGDVRRVRSRLKEASKHLALAKRYEAQAVKAFKAVPAASNQKKAYAAAVAKGKRATAQLVKCRADVRAATVALQKVVRSLKRS